MKTIIIAAAAALSLAACHHDEANRRAEVKDADEHAESMGDHAKGIGHDAKALGGDAVEAGHGVDNGYQSNHLQVGDLDLGRTLNEKGDIADRTQQFNTGDSIVASIDADNLKPGMVTATLKSKDGAVIATDTVEVKAGQENASFHLGTAASNGMYWVVISGPNGEIEKQSFWVGQDH